MLYSSFKCVRKFKFCESPLVEDGHTSEMQRFKNLYMELITNGKMLLNIDQTQGTLKTITYTNIVLCHVTYVVCYKYIIARVEGAYW